MEHNEIGINIAFYRRSLNLTQKQLGDKLGLASNTIANYENGTREPSLDLVVKLAKFFETTTDDLLGVNQ